MKYNKLWLALAIIQILLMMAATAAIWFNRHETAQDLFISYLTLDCITRGAIIEATKAERKD